MERHIVLTTVILFSVPALSSKTYRSDYIYSFKTDAFYKLHTVSATNIVANSICAAEGAKILDISSEKEVEQVHGMLKQFPDIGDSVWAGNNGISYGKMDTNIHELHTFNHLRIALSYCDTINRQGNIEGVPCDQRLPFICKVNSQDAPFDSQCGVFSSEYIYWPNVGSCYKIPRIRFSWDQAFDDCEAEGSHLVIINSDLEHQLIENITWPARDTYYWYRKTQYFFAGLRAEKTYDDSPRVFKSILGETLKEAGFDEWSPNEPNNKWGREYCGSISVTDGKYNDLDCSDDYPYICEKDVAINKNRS